jgi:MFS family permease
MSKAVASHDVNASEVAQASEIQRLLAEDTTPWYRKRNLRSLYFFLVPSALGVECSSGYDGSVLNGLQIISLWNEHFDNPSGATLGIVTASFNIGAVAGIPLIPYINDRFGRKACILFGSVLIAAGAIIQTLAVNVGMLLASRLIMGCGIPYAISGASQLIAELSYPKERAVITGLFNGEKYSF